jgi:hypothetical protein
MEGKRVIWSGIFTGDKPVRMEVVMPSTPAKPSDLKGPLADSPPKPTEVQELANPAAVSKGEADH